MPLGGYPGFPYRPWPGCSSREKGLKSNLLNHGTSEHRCESAVHFKTIGMAHKYAKFDRKLFAWLRSVREVKVTTASAAEAVGAAANKTQQRHISRRFTQLEDRGVLKCTLQGTTRICEVVGDIPVSLSKQPWRKSIADAVARQLNQEPKSTHSAVSIPATTSEEFLAKGGNMEVLPSRWDTPMIGSKPLGSSFTFDE